MSSTVPVAVGVRDAAPVWLGVGPAAIPEHLHRALSPATHFVAEWQEYWLRWPAAHTLVCNGTEIPAAFPDTFRLKFENELGLAQMLPMRAGRQVGAALHLEVISRKLGGPESHVRFVQTLVDDIHRRAARLPFAPATATARGVRESVRPPTPIFLLHFLLQHGQELALALATIRARPHRVLAETRENVPFGRVSYLDADVVQSILRTPESWVHAPHTRVASRLGGNAPRTVEQRISILSYDTPENRFVRAFVSQLAAAAAQMPRERWWTSVPAARRAAIARTTALLSNFTREEFLENVGNAHVLPASSRVMQRREGYRECGLLWQLSQQSCRAIFEPLRRSMDLRRIDELYQIWVFFTLVEEIASLLGTPAVVTLPVSDSGGLACQARAIFGDRGELLYDAPAPSYSFSMSPDYRWIASDGDSVVLDAKFRIDRSGSDEATRAKHDDLQKMHAYRDAFDVRAAVCIFPGSTAEFFDTSKNGVRDCTLRQILFGNEHGVGSLARSPVEES